VAKRCILEQKLLLTAYRKSYYEKSIGTQMYIPVNVKYSLFTGHVKVMSTIALHSTLNTSKTVRDRLYSKDTPIGNGLRGIKRSRDR